jgi:pimeloyl-ACP methyl ester carboxylesterase
MMSTCSDGDPNAADGLVADGLIADDLIADGLIADGLMVEPPASAAPQYPRTPPPQTPSLQAPPLQAPVIEAAHKTIYFISGLGADERIFQWLRCDGYQPKHIHWIEPERGEAIEAYATRLSKQIEDKRPIIVGLSFGGMIAVEVAKQIETEQVILLSSVKECSEIPIYFKLFRALPLHRCFPFKTLLWAFYWLAYWLFSPEGTTQKALLKTVLIETDPHFLKWALHKVVVWKNTTVPDTVVHVHGMRDRIFPHRFVTPDYSIENSGHLMVMNRAEELSNLLEVLIHQPAGPD